MSDINWHDVFDYRDGHLYWKIKAGQRVKVGDRAATLDPNGYFVFTYKSKRRYAHRVIFEMFNGKIPDGMEIDHINGVRNDNEISNLRLATKSQNMRNQRGANKLNKSSGIRGVTFSNDTGKWIARAKLNGKQVVFGYFKTKEEAGEVARLKRLELFGEFAGS